MEEFNDDDDGTRSNTFNHVRSLKTFAGTLDVAVRERLLIRAVPRRQKLTACFACA